MAWHGMAWHDRVGGWVKGDRPSHCQRTNSKTRATKQRVGCRVGARLRACLVGWTTLNVPPRTCSLGPSSTPNNCTLQTARQKTNQPTNQPINRPVSWFRARCKPGRVKLLVPRNLVSWPSSVGTVPAACVRCVRECARAYAGVYERAVARGGFLLGARVALRQTRTDYYRISQVSTTTSCTNKIDNEAPTHLSAGCQLG